MGGIVTTGISIKCDRCGKTVPVTENADADFYRAYSDRETQDEHMFVGALIIPGQLEKPIDMDFEFMCPTCYKAVLGYLSKIDKDLEKLLPPKKPKAKTDGEETTEGGKVEGQAPPPAETPPAAETKAEEPKVETPPAEEPKVETQPAEEPEVEEPPADEGSNYSDDDLFAP